MEHLHSQRPLTHDLMKSLADNLGVVLEEVYIYRWESGIFYSELRFRNGEELLKIDSRTSDAIALALRYNCPIYIAASVIANTAIPISDRQRENLAGKSLLNRRNLKQPSITSR